MNEEEFERLTANIEKSREAIVRHIGPWKRGRGGANGTSGIIDCPVCGATGALKYSRAASNGHIHAACTTQGCVRWME